MSRVSETKHAGNCSWQRSAPDSAVGPQSTVEMLESRIQSYQSQLQEYEVAVAQYQRKMRLMESRILQLELEVNQISDELRMETEAKKPSERKFNLKLTSDWVLEGTKSKINTSPKVAEYSSNSSAEGSIDYEVVTVDCPPAPCKLYKGSATSHLGKAYFTPSGSNKVYEFNTATSVWMILPDCPQSYIALSVVNGLLTAVGGESHNHQPLSTLTSLMVDSSMQDDTEGSHKWFQHFPPMPTRRTFPAVVSHDIYLVVAGGGTTWVQGSCSSNLTTVEVFNSCSLQWYTASSLPRPVRGSSMAVCGDSLYLLGGWDDTGNTVFICSMNHLLLSCIEVPPCGGTSQDTLSTVAYPHCLWSTVAGVPAYQSTGASLTGQLVAIGGRDSRHYCTSYNYTFHFVYVPQALRQSNNTQFTRFVLLVHCSHEQTNIQRII